MSENEEKKESTVLLLFQMVLGFAAAGYGLYLLFA